MLSLSGTRCMWRKLWHSSNGKAIPYKRAISPISGRPGMNISMSMAGITLTLRRLRDGRDYVLCGSQGRPRKRTKFRDYYRKAYDAGWRATGRLGCVRVNLLTGGTEGLAGEARKRLWVAGALAQWHDGLGWLVW